MAAERHSALVYRRPQELVNAVRAFAPTVLVIAPEHRELLACDGALVLDAAALVAEGAPSAVEFERVVGGAIDDLEAERPGAEVRVFGEAVDLLAARGDYDGANALEELWNSLAWSRRFSLLCAYRADLFDGEVGAAALPEMRRTHSHVTS
jgi:hypothetical protein